MKRLARLILAVAFIMVPISALALESIADKDMANVSGQAGVSIGIEEAIDINLKVSSLSYGDSDLGMAMQMTDVTADGMHINIGATTKDMVLEIKNVNGETVIGIGLPVTTIVVENIPSIKMGLETKAGGATTTTNLGTLNVGTTTLKVNSGKVNMKVLK
ncbi:MAG: hypothetical protein HQK79_10505 [Desulfobacterales bacterium]|nr:hypothetical protein [Desulfobacterales bacterium]MBF0398370.1 hypothetical protein [Desulfobacterales bacterium]